MNFAVCVCAAVEVCCEFRSDDEANVTERLRGKFSALNSSPRLMQMVR